MILSSVYHTFSCRSEKDYWYFLSYDLLGVALSLLAIYMSGVYYAFWCHKVNRSLIPKFLEHSNALSLFSDSPAFLSSYRPSDIHRGYDASVTSIPDKRQHQARRIRWLGLVRSSANPALDRGHGWHEESNSRSAVATSARHVSDKRSCFSDILQ